MEKYFIALDKMSIDEIEIIRLLSRYSNYETTITGYTVNQLVVNADKRLNLTTQKVRTILKKLEKDSLISEDALRQYSDEAQKLTDKYVAEIDKTAKDKEQSIMSI